MNATITETFVVARSRERESLTEDGVIWWKEYQLTRDRYDEWHLSARYMARVGGKVYARVDGKVALFTDPDSTWREMAHASTGAKAIDEHIGDTDFFQAVSLMPCHAEAVSRLKAAREKSRILHEAEEHARWTAEYFVEWKRARQKEFDKRHGDKTGAAMEKAQKRFVDRLRPEFLRLKAEAAQAKEAFDRLQKELEKRA